MNLKITGGKKLQGTITVNSSKNATVALMIASLLNKNKTILRQTPQIEEVYRLIEVLKSINVEVKWLNKTDLEIIPGKKIKIEEINKISAKKTRSILMLMGPLIHILKKFDLPQPGGCKLGLRTVRPHLFALEKLGVKIEVLKKFYKITSNNLNPNTIILYESGDTTTENILMACARINGQSIIKFASANYQIQDLCFFLQKLGVKVKGIGTSTLIIEGKKNINQPAEYHISEDPIEAMSFLSIAATTNSSLIIKRCPIDFLELELLKLEKMGFKYKILKKYKARNGQTNLVDIKTYASKLKALEEKIHPQPFPGLNIDNLPFFVPIATQAKGQTFIHDWIYEHRAIYYAELSKLGAKVILADPHRVYIQGPTKLKAAEIICPSALRPSMIILIAMLKAKGKSILRNVYSINRGYGNLVERLNKVGAKIEIMSR
jgi:UDP-N-acetylglucosamine 1-carboxyvinyltransferase